MLDTRPTSGPDSLIGREKLIVSALDLIDGGTSVDIVGAPSSGRTVLLAAIAARVGDRGGAALPVRGVPGLRAHPLAGLHAAGVGSSALPRDQRPATAVQHAVDALERATSASSSVIVIDDAGHLDETSLGVIDAVRARNGVPVIASYTSDGPAPDCMAAGYRLEMPPLRFDDLESLAVKRLGAPIDGTSMSRLYADSGGVAGVALSLLDAGCRDDSLSLVNGVWRADGPLWSPLLHNRVQRQLSRLDDAARDALHTISLLGDADLETVLEVCTADVVERLESAEAVRLVAGEGTPIVTVSAPYVSEYFRRSAHAIRSRRLTEGACAAQRRRRSSDHPAGAPAPMGRCTTDHPLLVRLIRDRAHAALVAASTRWERHGDAESAIDLVRAVAAVGNRDVSPTVVLAQTATAPGDPRHMFELARLRALFAVSQGRPLEAEEAALRCRFTALGITGARAEAAAIRLACAVGRLPSDAWERLTVEGETAPADRIPVLETKQRVALSLGRVGEARRLGETLVAEAGGEGAETAGLHGLALLADGAHAEATAWALDGIDAARNRLDATGIRSHGCAATLALVLAGRYSEAERIIADVLALGTPSPVEAGWHLCLLAVATVVAARRDNAGLREKITGELGSLFESGHPGAPVLAEWHRAQSLAYEDRPRDASVILRRIGDDLWKRNERLLAAFAVLVAVEMHADRGALATVTEWMRDIDSDVLRVRLDFLTARQEEDPRSMLDLPERLHATGQPGLAVTAFRLAAEWWRRSHDDESAARAEAECARFVDRLGPHPYDTVRFQAVAVNLTEREREIGRLVAKGLTNPQIAAQLVLSVRTVESHLHRIMRKTAVGNRAELTSLITNMTR